jgi:hypothetical protein
MEDQYLGDGLYVSFDGYQFRLWASNGIGVTNQVFLDGTTLENFERYVEKTKEMIKKIHEDVKSKGGSKDA